MARPDRLAEIKGHSVDDSLRELLLNGRRLDDWQDYVLLCEARKAQAA